MSDGLTPPARREGAGRFIESGARSYIATRIPEFSER
jgi:hypothetical protein